MIIYKYLDEKGALATLENNAVLSRAPTEFNDPFDSLFFPSDWNQVVSDCQAYKQFDNAVTANVSYALAKSLFEYIKKIRKIIGKQYDRPLKIL